MTNFILGSLIVVPLLFIEITKSSGVGGRDVLVLILSQNDSHHEEQANALKKQLLTTEPELKVYSTHEEFAHPGAWTVLPILEELNANYSKDRSWLFVCDSRTHIIFSSLLQLLDQFNASEEVWLGHALIDKEPTIIHHFAPSNTLMYPLFASGFAMSTTLLKRLAQRLSQKNYIHSQFSIDAQYELANFVLGDGTGPALTDSPSMCSEYDFKCATCPRLTRACAFPVSRSKIFFAVKTCEKFHKSRVGVIKKTWGKYAGFIEFYSDVADEDIPTFDLKIPNSERGHCMKTMAIIRKLALQPLEYPTIKWLVIADDDTLLSVSRLQEWLTCFDPDVPIILGERYGFNLHVGKAGYNYVTGGGGMIFSLAAAKIIAESPVCQCPDISTPDDMFIGSCASVLGIPVIHSSGFHQGRPDDYTADYLGSHQPISFHKYWLIDPLNVYQTWFAFADVVDPANQKLHIEL